MLMYIGAYIYIFNIELHILNWMLLIIILGVGFPMGKGMYRVVFIPEDEAVLLNSREKAPYLICVEVLKSEIPRYTSSC